LLFFKVHSCTSENRKNRRYADLQEGNSMKRLLAVRLIGVASFTVLCSASGRGQDTWTWPEKPKNLQVLPKDWTGTRLRPVMTGFTRALGVRCSYCHKGEEGKPLSTYDFASDENPNKNRAREMMRMMDGHRSSPEQDRA